MTTRRNFLKYSALAGGRIGLGMIPGLSLAAQKNPEALGV
jgi:hypothetical protein